MMCSHGIFEYSHVMYRTRPSRQYKGIPHVEITNNKPDHLDNTKVYLMSKSQTTSTFWLVSLCLFKYGILLLLSTTSFTCVPSIAPVQSLKCGYIPGFSKFGCNSENVGSFGTIMSCANLRRHVKTLLNVLLTVSKDLLKQLSACLTDCGEPTIHKTLQEPLQMPYL